MFGGYLAFYTKKSKALNIIMKTDYWAHPKNKLHNPDRQMFVIVNSDFLLYFLLFNLKKSEFKPDLFIQK